MIARCIIDNPAALRRCLRHPLPRSLLDSPFRFHVEFHPEKLLYPLFALYHSTHDESLCSNSGKRKGVEARGVLPWGICAPGAHRHSYRRKKTFQQLRVAVDLLDHIGIDLCHPTAFVAPPNDSANSHRFFLPSHAWILSSILHIELDRTPDIF